jgi:CRISPR-associated exonuclease Cas4
MYSESDFIMLSALQHYMFCPRQCALIHIEQVWEENRHTAEGRVMHERVDSSEKTMRDGVRIERTLPIRSQRLGISGQADVVEFHPDGRVFPVEYKRGKPKKDRSDEVQVCAQAMCLEEMLDVHIDEGALFYGKHRRRHPVIFAEDLRRLTEETALKIHELFAKGATPPPEYSKKCDSCSLFDICMPKACGKRQPVKRYLENMLRDDVCEKC